MLIKRLRISDLVAEPFSRWLHERQWAKPQYVFLFVFIIGFIDEIVVGTILGYWKSTLIVVGVFDVNNVSLLLLSLIVEPGVWAYYIWFPQAAIRFFNILENKQILMTERTSLAQRVQRLPMLGKSLAFRFSAFTVSIILTFYACYVISQYSPTPWFYEVAWHFYSIGIIRTFASIYVTVYSTMWSLATVYTIFEIFSKAKIDVKPYHEDNAGGLAFIGQFIMTVSQLTLIIVPFLIGEILFAMRLGGGLYGQANLWLEIVILPLLLGLTIYLPLISCHNAMVRARQDTIGNYCKNIDYHLTMLSVATDVKKENIDTVNALIDLQYRLNKEFPIWPFDISIRQQFSASFIIALIPVTLNIVMQIINLISSPK